MCWFCAFEITRELISISVPFFQLSSAFGIRVPPASGLAFSLVLISLAASSLSKKQSYSYCLASLFLQWFQWHFRSPNYPPPPKVSHTFLCRTLHMPAYLPFNLQVCALTLVLLGSLLHIPETGLCIHNALCQSLRLYPPYCDVLLNCLPCLWDWKLWDDRDSVTFFFKILFVCSFIYLFREHAWE